MDTLSLADKLERQRMVKAATNAARSAFIGSNDDDAAAQLACADRVIRAARKVGCTSDDLKVARQYVANIRQATRDRAEWAAHMEAMIVAAVVNGIESRRMSAVSL